MAPRPRTARTTPERLLRAAGQVFAARGYRGATMREIAGRAGTNLAAAHYHYGSKQALYLEVARVHFERLERRLAEQGGSMEEALEGAPSRADLVRVLKARVRTFLETLLAPDSVHATLMQRELIDPSAALPVIVRRWIDPMRRDTERILARLAPDLPARSAQRCVESIIGQVFFHLSHRPALLLLMRRKSYPSGYAEEVAGHIVDFSLGGLERIASRGDPPGRRAPRRKGRP